MLEISFQFTFTPGIHDLALALPTPAGIALILFLHLECGEILLPKEMQIPREPHPSNPLLGDHIWR